MLMTSETSPFRKELCNASQVLCFKHKDSQFLNNIIFTLSSGALLSTLFYLLFVRVPEVQRHMKLKKSFEIRYKVFKKSCIESFLVISGSGDDLSITDSLLNQDEFRKYFKSKNRKGQERWPAFANGLNDYYLKVLSAHLEAFRDEVNYLLNNTDVSDEQVFEFLKDLSLWIHMNRRPIDDYDSIKSFCGFLWSLFTGWDVVKGYTENDRVADMIKNI